MRALHVALHALGAQLATVEREVLPRLESDHLIVLHLELDAALLSAETAMRLDRTVHFTDGHPSARWLVFGVWAEGIHDLRYRNWQLCHVFPVPDHYRNDSGRLSARHIASWINARL